jgi:hypothetical protein
MMARGLIVDMAHMSDQSIDDTYQEIGKRAAGTTQPGPASLYPAIISHAHMRAQGLYEKVFSEPPPKKRHQIWAARSLLLHAVGFQLRRDDEGFF